MDNHSTAYTYISYMPSIASKQSTHRGTMHPTNGLSEAFNKTFCTIFNKMLGKVQVSLVNNSHETLGLPDYHTDLN